MSALKYLFWKGSKMIRLAVVGIGGYGWNLVDYINDVSKSGVCKLVAAADNRLTDFADKAGELSAAGVEVFDDAIKMFDQLRGKCDAIYIATSIQSHAPLAIAAMEAGYPVHLEKPPAATIQEVDRMIETQRRTGRLCMIGFQQIHGNTLQILKERIVSGRLGKIETVSCRAAWPRTASYYARNNWAGKLRSGDNWVLDGPAMNALAHQVNNMLYFASTEASGYAMPTKVRAELYAAGPVESHNTAAIEIQTADGPTVYWLGSHCADKRYGPTIEVHGDGGHAVWTGNLDIEYSDGSTESGKGDNATMTDMVKNFIDAIEKNDESIIRCKLSDTRTFALALNGAHESSGKIHRIDESFVRIIDEGTDEAATEVEGLGDMITEGAKKTCLLSDLENAPSWTVATQVYDLEGYENFPQQFLC